MKNLLLFFVFFVFISHVQSQTMQGTIKPGSTPRTIDVYLKPSASFSEKDEAMTFALAIPATVSPAPAMVTTGSKPNGTGQVLEISGLQPTFLVNNLGSTSREVVVSTQSINGTLYHIYTFIFAGTAATVHNWTGGVEQQLFSIQFDGCTNNCNPDNELLVNLPNGGNPAISFWYFQPNTLGDITNYPAPFYTNPQSTNPVNGGNLAALSYIGLATPVTLPVKLTSFTATSSDCNTVLSWRVAEQINGTAYTIERSDNGVSFMEVGHVKTNNTTYSFTDMTASTGTSYYRLKMANIDGQLIYSEVKEVSIKCAGISRVRVYPTLTSGVVNIKLAAGFENARIRVINTLGEEIASEIGKTANRSISLKGLANGAYILQIVSIGKHTDNFKITLQQ